MSHDDRITRRSFLEGAASASLGAGLAGCGSGDSLPGGAGARTGQGLPAPAAPPGRSLVSLVPCAAYRGPELREALGEALRLSPLPPVKGKKVLLKPNFVEVHAERPIHTDVRLLEALARLLLEAGAARVVIGEGPGHRRDTWEVWSRTGLIEVCRRLGISLVDLNYDELSWHPVETDPESYMGRMMLPRTALEADVIISVAKLKTHHWVGLTASLKNLFGLVPGVKYGWPKNVLHFHPKGIDASIAALARTFRPAYAVVDAVVAMEGDGPLMGDPVPMGLVLAGADLVAVDTACAVLMSLNPEKLRYLHFCEAAGLGRRNLDHILLAGADIKRYRRAFRLLPHLAALR